VNGDVDPSSTLAITKDHGIHDPHHMPLYTVKKASHHFWTHPPKETDSPTYGLLTWINPLFAKELHMENVYMNSFLFGLANLPGNIVTLTRKCLIFGQYCCGNSSIAGFWCLYIPGMFSSWMERFGFVYK